VTEVGWTKDKEKLATHQDEFPRVAVSPSRLAGQAACSPKITDSEHSGDDEGEESTASSSLVVTEPPR
jgi:hypothetical protein